MEKLPDVPEIPRELEQATGAQSTPTQVTTQVTDDTTGQPLTQSQATDDPVIEIPIDPVQSEGWRKWSLADTITWFTVFWLRAAKKAAHLGKKIVFIGGKNK